MMDEIAALHAIGNHARAKLKAAERKRRLEWAERSRQTVELIAKLDGHDKAWLAVEKGSRRRSTVSFS